MKVKVQTVKAKFNACERSSQAACPEHGTALSYKLLEKCRRRRIEVAALYAFLALFINLSPAAAASSTGTYSLPLLAPPTGPVLLPLVIARFSEIDKNLKSLSADFRQFVHFDQSQTTSVLEGALEYRKPNLLHIEHRLPEPQTIVCDGTWLWIWRRSTNQVIQTKLEDWKRSEPSAAGFLDFGGYAELLKRYDVAVATASPAASGHGNLELLLRAKTAVREAQDAQLKLTLSTRDFFPFETELKTGAVRIRSVLSNIRYNPPLSENRFRFTPPADADVFNNFKPPRPPGKP